MKLLTTLLIAVTSAVAAAQTATVTYSGGGCGFPSSPPPLIRTFDLPKLGGSFDVRLVGPSSVTPVSEYQPVLMTGLAPATIPLPPLPLQASLRGMCQLQIQPLVFQFMPRAGSGFQNAVKFQIPNSGPLLGLTGYQQWGIIYRRCAATVCTDNAIMVTDTMKFTIGI